MPLRSIPGGGQPPPEPTTPAESIRRRTLGPEDHASEFAFRLAERRITAAVPPRARGPVARMLARLRRLTSFPE